MVTLPSQLEDGTDTFRNRIRRYRRNHAKGLEMVKGLLICTGWLLETLGFVIGAGVALWLLMGV